MCQVIFLSLHSRNMHIISHTASVILKSDFDIVDSLNILTLIIHVNANGVVFSNSFMIYCFDELLWEGLTNGCVITLKQKSPICWKREFWDANDHPWYPPRDKNLSSHVTYVLQHGRLTHRMRTSMAKGSVPTLVEEEQLIPNKRSFLLDMEVVQIHFHLFFLGLNYQSR